MWSGRVPSAGGKVTPGNDEKTTFAPCGNSRRATHVDRLCRGSSAFPLGRFPVTPMGLPTGEDIVRLISLVSQQRIETGNQPGLDLEPRGAVGTLHSGDDALADPG